MSTFKTRPVPQLNPSLLPTHYDQWGSNIDRHIERASTTRPIHIMPWNDHVVAEGYVCEDDYNLKRALRDEGVIR